MEKIKSTIPNKPLSTKLANLFVEINSTFGHAKELVLDAYNLAIQERYTPQEAKQLLLDNITVFKKTQIYAYLPTDCKNPAKQRAGSVSHKGEVSVPKSEQNSDGKHSNFVSQGCMNLGESSTELKTDIDRQAEEGTREIVRRLQKQNRDLETRCSQLEELANERLMWKEKYVQLKQELKSPNSYDNKVLSGITEIEFGSEFLPVKIEYSFRTKQFSAWIANDAIQRVLNVLRRHR